MATAIVATTTPVIEKKEMIRALHSEHEFSDRFIAYHAFKEHPRRGGFGRSALQLE
jgi:hypothetical protein